MTVGAKGRGWSLGPPEPARLARGGSGPHQDGIQKRRSAFKKALVRFLGGEGHAGRQAASAGDFFGVSLSKSEIIVSAS